MVMRRVKYIEESPNKREIIFKDGIEWSEFFSKYFSEIVDKYGIDKYNTIWKYDKFKIKKNGEKAKFNDGSCLHTPKAIANQEKKWGEYIKKRRQNSIKVKENKERMMSEINEYIMPKGYYLKLCSGGMYSLKVMDK